MGDQFAFLLTGAHSLTLYPLQASHAAGVSDPFSGRSERRDHSPSALSASGPGPLPGPGPPWQRQAALPQLPGLPSTPAALPALDVVTLDEEWKNLLSFSRMHSVGAALPAQVWGVLFRFPGPRSSGQELVGLRDTRRPVFPSLLFPF